MKALKIILIALVLIIAIPLIIGLFTNKEYAVERSIVIDRPKQEVFDYIKYLRNQDHYSKWAEMDPNQVTTYTGIDGTPGFISAWEGNKDVGKGEQEITRVVDGERLETQLRFVEPFKSESDSYMVTESLGDEQTLVRWGFSGRMSWPLNLFLLMMDMDETIGADFDYGLGKLKSILETDAGREWTP
jgi:uncharacterized protein YndB with AHSA1/START domain